MPHQTANPASLKSLASTLVEGLKVNQGATIDFDTGLPPTVKGWAVSLPGAEMILPACPAPQLVEQWILEYALGVAAVAEGQGLRPYLGCWLDTEAKRVVFDISVLIPDLDAALAAAAKWGQKAVFHTGNQLTVKVEAQPA
jgi:hypothetical protein